LRHFVFPRVEVHLLGLSGGDGFERFVHG
jgi:hypothetical protein